MKIKIFSTNKTMSGDQAAHELENQVNTYLETMSKEEIYQITPIANKNGHTQQIMILFKDK